MRLVLDQIRQRLLRDMRAVFSGDAFASAYPGVPAPMVVSVGGSAERPPFEVIVRELPEFSTGSRATSCPIPSASLTWQVDLVCSGATVEDASRSLIAYIDAVHQALMADPSLGGLVPHVIPSISQLGTAYEGNGVVAGALVQIAMERDWPRNEKAYQAVVTA